MATDTKSIVPLPFAGGGQGYTRQPDGSFALDVNVASSGGVAQPASTDAVYYSSGVGGIQDTTDATAFPAAGNGVRNYMTGLQYLNSGATAGEIVVKDGAAVIWRGYAPGGMEALASIYFPTALRGSPNTAMNIALLMGQMAVRVSAQGFKGA